MIVDSRLNSMKQGGGPLNVKATSSARDGLEAHTLGVRGKDHLTYRCDPRDPKPIKQEMNIDPNA